MSTELVKKLSTEVIIPDSVNVGLKSSMLSVEGPLGKAYKNFKKIPVKIEIVDNKLFLMPLEKEIKIMQF